MIYPRLQQKSPYRFNRTLAGVLLRMRSVSVSANTVQPNAYPGTGPLLNLRSAGQEKRLDFGPSYSRLRRSSEDQRKRSAVLPPHELTISCCDMICLACSMSRVTHPTKSKALSGHDNVAAAVHEPRTAVQFTFKTYGRRPRSLVTEYLVDSLRTLYGRHVAAR